MKAIILAAGEGTRLRPLTADRPKCMVDFQGQPLIDTILETMHGAGVTDITVVTGYQDQVLKNYLTEHFPVQTPKTCHNARYDRTNMVSTLFCAESVLSQDDDVIMSYSDILYTPAVLQTLIDAPGDVAVVVDTAWQTLWEARLEDPLTDAETLKLDDTRQHILELGKKPQSYADIQGQYIGLVKFSRAALPAIRQFYHQLDRQAQYDGKSFDTMFMTSFIQLVIDRLMPVNAAFISGGWLEIDTLSDLETYEASNPLALSL